MWWCVSTATRREDIPEGFCWVEGDNLAMSEDSNIFGPVGGWHGEVGGERRVVVVPRQRVSAML